MVSLKFTNSDIRPGDLLTRFCHGKDFTIWEIDRNMFSINFIFWFTSGWIESFVVPWSPRWKLSTLNGLSVSVWSVNKCGRLEKSKKTRYELGVQFWHKIDCQNSQYGVEITEICSRNFWQKFRESNVSTTQCGN